MIEQDKNITQNATPNFWPRMNLFPRLTAVGRFLGSVLSQQYSLPPESEIANTGAQMVLDEHLDADERMFSHWGATIEWVDEHEQSDQR